MRKEKVEFEILIRVPRERVFQSIATSEGLDEWFTDGTSLEAGPGGEICFRWKNWGLQKYSGEYPGQVIEINPPSRFVFQWMADSGGYYSTAEFDFTQVDEGTIVRIVEHGFTSNPEGLQDLLNRTSGWAHVLTLLKFYLEHGETY